MVLFCELQKASISRYISFSKQMLPRNKVKMFIREMQTVGYINKDMLKHWKVLMQEHNRILARGERLGLCSVPMKARSLTMSSLDMYMVQMQSRYLAEILDDLTSFGERVIKRIGGSPMSLLWVISGPILVERRSWVRFCQQMMSLLHSMGMDGFADKLHLDPWPDRERLESSALRARQVFEIFASARPGQRSISIRQGAGT